MGKVIMSGCAKNATIPSGISTFTVSPSKGTGGYGNPSYNFKVGMTWEEFINSKYNVENKIFLVSDSNYVHFAVQALVLVDQYDNSNPNTKIIRKTDVIIANYKYYYTP